MRPSRVLAAALALCGAAMITVDFAEARVGGGRSFGSRGGKTFTAPPSTPTAPGTAQPMQRSMTQSGAPAAAQTARPGAAAAAPSRFGSGFGGLLMGGLLGAGLFGLLSGAGLFGGLSGLAGVLGLLLQVALIAGAVYLVMGFFRNRTQPAMARSTTGGSGGPVPQRTIHGGSGLRRPADGGFAASAAPLAIVQQDYDTFERLLGEIQDAFGRGDVDALATRTTPEMLSYFSQQLADNTQAGVRNEVSGAKLLQGDLAEAWRETGSDYATVAMRYALIDAVVERNTGRVVSGSQTAPQEVTEVWTFRRDHRGGEGWQLSAIQQTA